MDTSKLPALVFLQGGTIQSNVLTKFVERILPLIYILQPFILLLLSRSIFYNLLSCYFSPDGIPEQFDGNLNIGSDISDWIRREVTADEIEVNLENFIL